MKGVVRLLYISSNAERGGVETVLCNLVKYHDRERYRLSVLFLKDGPLVEEFRRLGIQVFLIKTGRFSQVFRSIFTILKIRRLIINEHIDVVFSQLAMAHLYGGLAAKLSGRKCIWYQHVAGTEFNWLNRLALKIKADMIFVNSAFTERSLRKAGIGRQRTEIVYPGIDTEAFEAPGAAARDAFSLAADDFVVGTVGRFQYGKGQHVLIEALPLIREAIPAAKLMLVGSEQFGLERGRGDRLRELAAARGVEREVVFPGFLDDVPGALRCMDVFVLPSVYPESFGLVLCEAMYMKKPVIATRSGGPEEIVEDGVTGLLVDASPEAIARAVCTIYRNPELARALAEKGFAEVRERFTAARMTKMVEDKIKEIM